MSENILVNDIQTQQQVEGVKADVLDKIFANVSGVASLIPDNVEWYVLNNVRYYFNKDGFWIIPPNKKEEIRIGNYMKPIGYVRDKLYGDSIVIEVKTDSEDELVEIILPTFDIRGNQILQILAKCGYMVDSHKGMISYVGNFLLNYKKGMKYYDAAHKTGWSDDDKCRCFTLPKEYLTSQDFKFVEYTWYCGSLAQSDSISEKGSVQEWKENVLPLCLDHKQLLIGLLVAFSSFTSSLFKTGYMMHYYGRSSKGKTTLLQLAASIIGNRHYVGGWNTTLMGALEYVNERKDIPVLLDELTTYQGKEDISKLIYTLINPEERIRHSTWLKKNKIVENLKYPRILSTGEIPVEYKELGGIVVRAVNIKIDDLTISRKHSNDIKRITNKYYGAVGKYYIRWLIDNIHNYNLTKMVEEQMDYLYNRYPKMNELQQRISQYFAELIVVAKLLKDADIINATLTDMISTMFNINVYKLLTLLPEENLIIRELQETTDACSPFFIISKETEKVQTIGYIDDNSIFYLKMHTFHLHMIRKYKGFSLTKIGLAEFLVDKKIINKSIIKSLSGKSIRVHRVNNDILEQL